MKKGIPLIWASRCGYVQIAQRLVLAGCDVDRRDKDGTTALVFAARKNRVGESLPPSLSLIYCRDDGTYTNMLSFVTTPIPLYYTIPLIFYHHRYRRTTPRSRSRHFSRECLPPYRLQLDQEYEDSRDG